MALSLDAAQAAAARAFRDGGIGTAALDARVLLTSATGLSLETLIAQGRAPLSSEAESRFAGYVSRRLAGEPVSRIRGVREFYGREFLIDQHTLDPRPDTETLVEAALQAAGDAPLKVLDLGTGSGCVLVTLLAELPLATGIGTDISEGALSLARKNAERLGVAGRAEFFRSDWFDSVTGCFDLIVSNPPYLESAAIEGLSPEVARHDPRTALDGGPDGLDAYRIIARQANKFLAPGGVLLVETGQAQTHAVAGLFSGTGLPVGDDGIVTDLAGLPRCVRAKIAPEKALSCLGQTQK